MIARRWKDMDKHTRQRYEWMADQDRRRYARELENYNRRNKALLLAQEKNESEEVLEEEEEEEGVRELQDEETEELRADEQLVVGKVQDEEVEDEVEGGSAEKKEEEVHKGYTMVKQSEVEEAHYTTKGGKLRTAEGNQTSLIDDVRGGDEFPPTVPFADPYARTLDVFNEVRRQ